MDDIAELRREAMQTATHGLWTTGGPVFARLSEETVQGLQGQAIATIGDAATLGLWAFATGSGLAGLFQANILPAAQVARLFPALLVYSGLVLFVAGLFLFRRNNSFLASSFCSFGAFNATRGVLLLSVQLDVIPLDATTNLLQGCLLECFAYIGLSLFFGALRVNAVAALCWRAPARVSRWRGCPTSRTASAAAFGGAPGRSAGISCSRQRSSPFTAGRRCW